MNPFVSPKGMLLLILLLTLSVNLLGDTQKESVGDISPLRAMIALQKSIHTLSADFTQSRSLKTLRDPLISHGKLWIQPQQFFRWELGTPPKTIVIGTPTETTVIQPFKKTASKKIRSSPIGGTDTSEAFGMMSLPGNGGFDDFQREVRILRTENSAGIFHVEFIPKNTEQVRGLTAIRLDFNSQTGQWIRLEFLTRDGSSIRNDFTDIKTNQKLDPHLFGYNLTGFRISDEKK
ncbi:MAG: outer membrane lipoprotein carrier protein LolA [Verrucomicrobia bacterium]|nr:outer membrane lipoprotein carrier protein LolA [Verrucomicrobiota bacterium]